MGFKVDDVFVDFIVDFSQGEKGARRINAEMAKMGKVAGVAADAQDRVERSSKRAGKAMKQTAKSTTQMQKASKKAGSEIKRMIKTMIGLEVARRVLSAFLRTFVNFRQEMNNVRAITDATDDQFARLNATAKELGRTTQFTATDAARAMAFLARTGLDVNQTIAVLPGTLNLAAATAVDLATAADLSTNILKGMGLEISELDGLVDILAKTTNSANVNIFELGEAMKIVAPVAADAGVSVQRLSAMIGILGDAGIKGTLAGTALRRSILAIQTGSGTAGEALSGLGIQVEDAEGNLIGLDQVLRALEGGLVSDSEAFKIFGLRAISAAKVLAGRGVDDIDAFEAALFKAGGTAERMAEQQMAGLPGALKRLKSETEGAAIAWGDAFEPALIVGTTALRGVIKWINGLLAAIKFVSIAAFVMAEGAGLAFVTMQNSIGIAIGGIVTGLGKLFTLIGEAGERFGVLPGMSEALANVGLKLELFGQRTIRRDVDDIKDGWEELKSTWVAAGVIFDEVIDDFNNATGAADETAGAIGQLAGAVEETTAAMQRARTQLNLDVFTTQLEALRALLRETFGLEGQGALGLEARLEIQRQLVGMTDDQVAAAQALVQAEQELAGAVAEVVAIQEELNAAGEDQEKIADLTAQLEAAVSALAAATRDADEAMENLGKSGKGIGDALTKIALAVRGINRLADAFGIVNDDVRKAIDSVLDLINTIKALEAAKGALDVGTVLGLAGAAAGLFSALGGLFGGAQEDPAVKRREEEKLQAAKNTNLALAQLRESFERSLSVLLDFTGEEIGRALTLASEAGRPRRFRRGDDPRRGELARVLTEAEFAFLERVAATLGLELERTAESFQALEEAIKQIDLSRFTETFAGAMNLLQRRFALFDIDKPADRLQAMLDLLAEFGSLDVALPTPDTEAGRAALQALIESLFEEIAAGTFDISRLGGLTLGDFLDLLASMEGLLDDLGEDGVTTDDGLTENFVRSTRITEVQGNELLTLARTELVVERQQLTAQLEMVNLLGIMAGIAAPPPGTPADLAQTAAPIDVGGVTVNATLVITEEVDADAIVERLGVNLAVVLDRQLRELQTREDRAVGDVGRVA